MSGVQNCQTYICELGEKPTVPKRRGPNPSKSATVQKAVSLPPDYWAFIEQWSEAEDYTERPNGETHWNPSPALFRCLIDCRRMFPRGTNVGRERGSDGRFIGRRPPRKRATRQQLEARIRELETALKEAKQNPGQR